MGNDELGVRETDTKLDDTHVMFSDENGMGMNNMMIEGDDEVDDRQTREANYDDAAGGNGDRDSDSDSDSVIDEAASEALRLWCAMMAAGDDRDRVGSLTTRSTSEGSAGLTILGW